MKTVRRKSKSLTLLKLLPLPQFFVVLRRSNLAVCYQVHFVTQALGQALELCFFHRISQATLLQYRQMPLQGCKLVVVLWTPLDFYLQFFHNAPLVLFRENVSKYHSIPEESCNSLG